MVAVAAALASRAELSMVLSSWLSGDLRKQDLTLCLCWHALHRCAERTGDPRRWFFGSHQSALTPAWWRPPCLGTCWLCVAKGELLWGTTAMRRQADFQLLRGHSFPAEGMGSVRGGRPCPALWGQQPCSSRLRETMASGHVGPRAQTWAQ